MKQIKKTFGIIAWLAAIMLLALACSNFLDVDAGYTDNLAKRQKNSESEDGKNYGKRISLLPLSISWFCEITALS